MNRNGHDVCRGSCFVTYRAGLSPPSCFHLPDSSFGRERARVVLRNSDRSSLRSISVNQAKKSQAHIPHERGGAIFQVVVCG